MPGAFFSKRNILFDLDGTLVDSSAAHARAYVRALELDHPEHAKSFVYDDSAGRPTREVLAELGLAASQLDSLTKLKQEAYRAALTRGEVVAFPGIAEMLGHLMRMERQLFVVTGASRIAAERILQQLGLADFFSGMITAEDVAAGKPAAAPYLRALSEFHLVAKDCLVVEDGKSGVASAQAAGLEVVLLHPNTNLEFPGIPRFQNAAELLHVLSA